jgi:hypothetical protein
MDPHKYLQEAEGEKELKRSIELKRPHIEDLEFGPRLGSGSFGKVYRGTA